MKLRARNLCAWFALASLPLLVGQACHKSDPAGQAAKNESPAAGNGHAQLTPPPAQASGAQPGKDAGTGGTGGHDTEDPSTAEPVACTDDEHEPDDTVEEAEAHAALHHILPIDIPRRTACGQEMDVIWAGRVDAGGKAGAELKWDTSLGALELSLLDGNGSALSKLDVAVTQPGHVELMVKEYFGAYFYVQVYNPGVAAIPYSLKVTAQEFGP